MTEQATGTETPALIGTEYTLADLTVPATYVSLVDLSAMEAGDVVTLNIYVAVLSGGTPKSVYTETFNGVQPPGSVVAISLPVPSLYEWELTLTQTAAGTPRAFPWTVLSL